MEDSLPKTTLQGWHGIAVYMGNVIRLFKGYGYYHLSVYLRIGLGNVRSLMREVEWLTIVGGEM